MIVDYTPNWFNDMRHLEFHSPYKPPRRIPISETGYRSHFGDREEIEAAGPQEYARAVVLAHLRGSRATAKADEQQLALF